MPKKEKTPSPYFPLLKNSTRFFFLIKKNFFFFGIHDTSRIMHARSKKAGNWGNVKSMSNSLFPPFWDRAQKKKGKKIKKKEKKKRIYIDIYIAICLVYAYVHIHTYIHMACTSFFTPVADSHPSSSSTQKTRMNPYILLLRTTCPHPRSINIIIIVVVVVVHHPIHPQTSYLELHHSTPDRYVCILSVSELGGGFGKYDYVHVP